MRVLVRLLRIIGVVMVVSGAAWKFFQLSGASGGLTYNPASDFLLYGGIALIVLTSILAIFTGIGGLTGRKVKNGALALGVIRDVRQTGTYINNNPQVLLLLQVTKQDGTEFEASIKPIIPLTELSQFTVNTPLPVEVDERNQVGLATEAVDSEKFQALYEKWGVKHGLFTAEAVEIKKHGEESYAAVHNLVPLGSMQQAVIPVELELTLTTVDKREIEVTLKKEVPQDGLSYLQPGNIIQVVYLPADPKKLIIIFPNSPAAVRKSFENVYSG